MNPMDEVCNDLLQEYRELAALCGTLSAAQWQQPGPFYGWTSWDEIAHLCYFDEAALQSVREPEAFARDARQMMQQVAAGESISSFARRHFCGIGGPELLARWVAGFEHLTGILRELEPKARLAWYGPAMGVRSFASARLMEVWAHGQDVWDTVRRRRPGSHRLKHVAHLGATTFGWTFVNRKLAVPAVVPRIELTAPDGTIWAWGEAGGGDFVRGSPEDFCLVVTQRRHVADTDLRYSDGAVKQWLQMAQCFAGPPADGPAPGVRKIVY